MDKKDFVQVVADQEQGEFALDFGDQVPEKMPDLRSLTKDSRKNWLAREESARIAEVVAQEQKMHEVLRLAGMGSRGRCSEITEIEKEASQIRSTISETITVLLRMQGRIDKLMDKTREFDRALILKIEASGQDPVFV